MDNATDTRFRPLIGGYGTDSWAVFRESHVKQFGLWCQVSPVNTDNIPDSNIGDWYYPTASGGFTILTNTTNDGTPYQSLKCTNQIGLVVDGNVTNYQGIVRCTTTVPGLDNDNNYMAVYKDEVFGSLRSSGPTVDSNMTMSILSSRNAAPNITFKLSFNMSFGLPSLIDCTRDNDNILKGRGISGVHYEVIRSQYISSSLLDMTHLSFTQTRPRMETTYSCTVTVEGRRSIAYTSGTYRHDVLGSRTSSVTVNVAGTPTAVTANWTGHNSVLVSWTAPSPAPAGYEVFYQTASAGLSSRLSGGNTSNTELTLTGLTLGETYSIFVVAFGAEGDPVLPSNHSNMASVMIPHLPRPNDELSLTPNFSSIMVSWTPQFAPDSYNISYSCQLLCDSELYLSSSDTVDGTATTHTITSLNAGSNCTVSVTAVFGSSSSNTVTSSTNTTSAVPTSAPGGLTSTSVESRSLTMQWGTVLCPDQRGPITGYRLRYSNGFSIVDTAGEGSRQHVLTGLTPFTSYSVQVAAVNDGGTGPYSDPALTVETLQNGEYLTAVASGVIAAAILVIITIIMIIVGVVLIRKRKQSSTFAVHYLKEGPKVDINHSEDVPQYAVVASKPLITVFPEDSITIVEGRNVVLPVKIIGSPQSTLTWYHDNTRLGSDYAHEISSDGSLTIITAEMRHSGTYRLVASNSEGTVEKQFSLSVVSEEDEELPSSSVQTAEESKPVPVAEFGQYVSQNHANTNSGFTVLYQSLDSGEADHSVTVGVTAANKSFNRFKNITVYDDNRVLLRPLSGCSDCQRDYINASYIDGYEATNKYIACQGPLNATLVDFWRMIWQEKSHTVVMVTNLKEDKKTKCQQYWSEDGTKSFGQFTVTTTDQQVFADYTIRLQQLELKGSSEFPRMITQYHFTSWPDHGVPEYATPILAYHRRIKKDHKPSKGPMIVHCSAGVGRTGTFIAIDTILEQVKKEKMVDVSGVINKMRHQRMKMVQTAEQFIFIHDVILESVMCGDTQVISSDLRSAVTLLTNKDDFTGKTGFETQFETLNQVTPKPSEVKAMAATQHKNKNRSMEFLPPDKHRVHLRGVLPDYIHATAVNGYKQKKALIVAQSPMESTIRDFWKMIVERECRVVVMLCGLEEDGNEVCHQYWPTAAAAASRVEKYNELSVECKQENSSSGYIERVLDITDKTGRSHEVTQFHILNWTSSHGKCSSALQTIITVVEEVYKVQRRTDNKPIVVHCSDTVSRSGMFCAIATTIDRCKTESVVDVFQVVKAQRIQKPGLVLTVEQYQFVFEAVLRFLESFETYSNFK